MLRLFFKPYIPKNPTHFLDQPLPYYSKEQLTKILSHKEKEFAKSIENSHSSVSEIAESYHQNSKAILKK